MKLPSPEQRKLLDSQINRHHETVGPAESYLLGRGISSESITRFRLGFVDGGNGGLTTGRLAIPYLTPAGAFQIKYRCILDHNCKDHGHPKYYYPAGDSLHLFNAQTLRAADDIVVVVEGELDAIVVEQLGFPAVAYPGAESWKVNQHWRWCFDSVDEIVVVADGDEPKEGSSKGAGQIAAEQVAKSLRQAVDADVTVVTLPVPHDTNSYVIEYGDLDYLYRIGVI